MKNRYKVRKEATKAGLRSGFELRIAKQLDEAGIKYTYETQSINYFDKAVGYKCADCDSNACFKERWYTPDFFLENGIIIEVKGKFTAANRKKHKAIKELHPELDVRMLFMRDNWLTKTHSAKYSTWCEQNDIKYAIGKVPEEWLDEDVKPNDK